MCFKGTRCDHKLQTRCDRKPQDPRNILLTDLTISSLCVDLKSHGWLAVDVPMASKGKEDIEKSCPCGRGLGSARAVASATRWHHRPLRKHLSRWKLNPWSPALTPPLLGRPVFPQRPRARSACRCRHGPPPRRRHLSLVAAACSFRLVLASRAAGQDGPGRWRRAGRSFLSPGIIQRKPKHLSFFLSFFLIPKMKKTKKSKNNQNHPSECRRRAWPQGPCPVLS